MVVNFQIGKKYATISSNLCKLKKARVSIWQHLFHSSKIITFIFLSIIRLLKNVCTLISYFYFIVVYLYYIDKVIDD